MAPIAPRDVAGDKEEGQQGRRDAHQKLGRILSPPDSATEQQIPGSAHFKSYHKAPTLFPGKSPH